MIRRVRTSSSATAPSRTSTLSFRAAIVALFLIALQACAGPLASRAELELPSQDPKPPTSSTTSTQAKSPSPALPDFSKDLKFDWIKLTSGEWLKGELDVLRRDSLEFDSDKLDDLKIDWEDVAEVHTCKKQMVLIEGPDGRETYVGKVDVKDGVIEIDGKTKMRFDRKKLLALVPGEPTERNYWSGKVNIGFTTRSGNTNQTDFSSYIFARRQTSDTRWDTTYNGAFGRVEGVETVNNNRLDSKFDVFLTRRLYVTPAGIQLFQDRFQNIDTRTKPYAGIGYDLMDRDGMTWNINVFGAYEKTEFSSVPDGDPTSQSSAAVVFGTRYEWDATSTVELKLDYSITVPVPSTENYNHHLSTVISVDVIGDLDLDVTFVWDRLNNPPLSADNTRPEQDDYRLTVGIGYSF